MTLLYFVATVRYANSLGGHTSVKFKDIGINYSGTYAIILRMYALSSSLRTTSGLQLYIDCHLVQEANNIPPIAQNFPSIDASITVNCKSRK